jgi:L,D-peptidoglycan transpeptidase YkuD (ErfK/YbiS/YcfS/YnhG family)
MPDAMNHTPIRTCATLLALAIVLSWLAGCAHRTPVSGDTVAWHHARQLILVTTPDWNATSGTLRTYERDREGAWQEHGEGVPITVGRSGSAWGLGLHPAQPGVQKREGDGRAPAGVFAIGQAFGYGPDAATALPYAQMQATSWCMDVVGSPLYNRIVDAAQVGDAAVQGSTEPMRLDLHNDGDQRYRNGFVILHNARAEKGAGSCIFAHLWGKPGQPTAGCTAMAPESMQRLYAWLKPEANPAFVLLPEDEYRRLRTAWGLP